MRSGESKKGFLVTTGVTIISLVCIIATLTGCNTKDVIVDDTEVTPNKVLVQDSSRDMALEDNDNSESDEEIPSIHNKDDENSDAEGISQTIVINEVCSKNSLGITASDGEHYDWIELYNTSDTIINIEGYMLSDDDSNPERYEFPSVTIEAGEYLLVFVDNDARLGEDEYIADFGISKDGETLILGSPEDIIIDKVEVPAIAKDTTYGRKPDGSVSMGNMNPTPGRAN